MTARHARHVLIASGIVLAMVTIAEASGPPFELAVKNHHLFGSSRGTLVFSVEGVEYRTGDTKEARLWTYQDIKQVDVRSPTRLTVLTYEDQGGLKFGVDRAFNFELVDGPVAPELVTFLLARAAHPVITRVLPSSTAIGAPVFLLPVKHQRGRHGASGMLALYDDGLAFKAARERDSRFWRLADIYSVLRVDRYRLEVVTYEGGAGSTRRFLFELKADLPQAAQEALWVRVNPPTYELRREETARIAETPR